MKKRIVVSATYFMALVLVASVFACSSQSEPREERTAAPDAQGTPIVSDTSRTQAQETEASREGRLLIGNLVDTSGAGAEFGEAHRKAADLAARHITEAGGPPVTVIHRDTGSDPTKAVDAARELIDIENVAAIVGAPSGDSTIAVAESVAAPEEILLISPSATSRALTNIEDEDFVFRTIVSDTGQATVLATVAIGEDHETAGIMHIDDSYGQGLADQFTQVFEILGGKVTAAVGHHEAQESYTAELQQVIAEDPDVFVAVSYPAQAEVYLSELIERGYTGKVLLADAAKSSEMVEALGADALEGTLGANPGTRENRALKAFNTAYWETFAEVPSAPFLAQTYDTVVLISLAAAKAGTITDSKAIRDALRDVAKGPGAEVTGELESIKEAFRLIANGEDIDYEGVSGSMEFNESGDVNGTIEIWKIEGGEIISTGRFEYPYVPVKSKDGGAIAW